jgi:mono/diheme cytochrome c family protein
MELRVRERSLVCERARAGRTDMMKEMKARHSSGVVAVASLITFACFGTAAVAENFGFGTTPTEDEIAAINIDVMPDGRGYPKGSGTVAQGEKVYAEKCAACHGDDMQGVKGTGAAALTGGRGSIGTEKTKKTVESYWPYASTLFDYTKRAMPFNAPGSLTDDEVYAVSAYILHKSNIIDANATMNAETMSKVEMPNKDGFIPDPRPDVHHYR